MSSQVPVSGEDPGCFGAVLSCLLGDDKAADGQASGLSHHSDQKPVAALYSDESNTCTFSAEASLSGESDVDGRIPHASPSLAIIEALEEESDASPLDGDASVDRTTLDEGNKLGEESLAAMAGYGHATGKNQDKDQRGQRNVLVPPPTTKPKQTASSSGASSLTHSFSKRSSSLVKRTLFGRRRQSCHKEKHVHVGLDEHETAIDALVLEQEEPITTSARFLDFRERSADQRYFIEYVKSEDNGTGSDVDDDCADVLEASYNAQDEGIIVPPEVSVSSAATSTNNNPDNVSKEDEDGTNLNDPAGAILPIEVVLDESDDDVATSTGSTGSPKVTGRSMDKETRGSGGRPKSKVASTLRRSVGSLRRVGSRAMQRTTSKGENKRNSMNQNVNQMLQLDDTMPTSPDSKNASRRNSGGADDDMAEMCYNSNSDDDDISDNSSSIDETSSEKLRRRVVEVEERIQSQISQAKSFDSQQTQDALLHRSNSDHRGICSSRGTTEREQVIVDLGGYDGIITSGGRLETSDGVSKFKGMFEFIEQGIYDTVTPIRSRDENLVVKFIEAPATDPVSSGLVGPFDNGSDDDADIGESYLDEEDGEVRKKSSKRRPLDFLRKKQKDTDGHDRY